jgi:hypothetical protein
VAHNDLYLSKSGDGAIFRREIVFNFILQVCSLIEYLERNM